MKVTIFRTAMIGGGLSYDVNVPISEVADYQPSRQTTILRDGKSYIDFEHATLPREHYAMPLGWPKYEHFLNHEKKARAVMLDICKQVFPELRQLPAHITTLPELWINGLMAHETSAVKIIDHPIDT